MIIIATISHLSKVHVIHNSTNLISTSTYFWFPDTMYLWLSTWRSHVDRQCPPLLHYPPQQCRWSAALFPHWITTDQHSISMKCNIRAPLYCTCFVAPLVHFPCFNTTYKYCSVIEGFTLPVHSKQMRLTLVHSIRPKEGDTQASAKEAGNKPIISATLPLRCLPTWVETPKVFRT